MQPRRHVVLLPGKQDAVAERRRLLAQDALLRAAADDHEARMRESRIVHGGNQKAMALPAPQRRDDADQRRGPRNPDTRARGGAIARTETRHVGAGWN